MNDAKRYRPGGRVSRTSPGAGGDARHRATDFGLGGVTLRGW